MHDAKHVPDSSSTGSALMGFALGAVIGAGLALLLAPDRGSNTRRRLASTARDLGREAEHALDQARDTVTGLGTDARSAIQAGRDALADNRATREARSERRLPHADDTSPGLNSPEHPAAEAAR